MALSPVIVGLSGRQQVKAQRAAAGQAAAAAPAPAPAPVDPIAQLKDLAALKQQGVLTEEEFTAQKARILEA